MDYGLWTTDYGLSELGLLRGLQRIAKCELLALGAWCQQSSCSCSYEPINNKQRQTQTKNLGLP
jgi:hypothetical protein